MAVRILFQGDSITDAGRKKEDPLSLGRGYPYLIDARLGVDAPGKYEVINRGVSGNRVPDLYARIVRDVLNIKPDVLSILIGVNDVWHGMDPVNGNGTGAARYEKIYDLFLTEVQEALPDVKLLVLEPFVLPGDATNDREDDATWWNRFNCGVREMAVIARRLAEKHGAVFVELQKTFDEALEQAPASHWLRDGVHPTGAGHELIARKVLKVLP